MNISLSPFAPENSVSRELQVQTLVVILIDFSLNTYDTGPLFGAEGQNLIPGEDSVRCMVDPYSDDFTYILQRYRYR